MHVLWCQVLYRAALGVVFHSKFTTASAVLLCSVIHTITFRATLRDVALWAEDPPARGARCCRIYFCACFMSDLFSQAKSSDHTLRNLLISKEMLLLFWSENLKIYCQCEQVPVGWRY